MKSDTGVLIKKKTTIGQSETTLSKPVEGANEDAAPPPLIHKPRTLLQHATKRSSTHQNQKITSLFDKAPAATDRKRLVPFLCKSL